MEKSGNCNEIDQFYRDLCNRLRDMGKASSFCQLIKNAKNDLDRIVILNKDCNIIPSLIKVVRKCRKNNSKDNQQARETLNVYYSNKNNCSESDKLIRLLNLALTHVEIDNKLDVEQFENFEKDEIAFLEDSLLDDAEASTLDGGLISEIYRERANYFHDIGDHKISVLEALRALRYAKFDKNNPNESLFSLLFRISTSLKHLNQWKMASNVLQFSIKSLRSSTLDNAAKSVETVRLVKLLKEIQVLSKEGGESGEKALNFKCYSKPKSDEDFPKIFHSTSDTLVNGSSCLELKWHADRGRHLIATKTIPPGSTIIVERPFSWIVHPNESLLFCQNCCREVKNLIPCNNCSALVFCSRQCKAESEDYHQYECEFMKSLTSSEILGEMALLCYRTITKTDFKILESHIREYIQEHREDNAENQQIFHDKFILGLDERRKLDSSNYTSVFAQTPNTDVRLGGDILKRSFSAIVLTICLRLTGYFKSVEEIDSECNLSEMEELVACVFLRHLQSASCNAYGINRVSGHDPRCLQINEIGGGTYPIISTTNHSCNSNVYRFSVGKTCIVKTLREIHAGEEILDSYGPHFASNSIEERSRLLNGQYLFNCCCSACVENWLIYSKLQRENPHFRCTKCESSSCTKKKDKHICLECSNVFDTSKSVKVAKECHRQFQAAKERLLSSSEKTKTEYETIQNSIAKYSNVLARTQKLPCQVLIECQEAFKLCWNLQNRT